MKISSIIVIILIVILAGAFIFFLFKTMIEWDNKRKRNNGCLYLIGIAFLSFITFIVVFIIIPTENIERDTKQIVILKKLESDSISGKVPPKFYSNRGFRDWYRYPLIYPYSINWADSPYSGGIVMDERNVKDINWSSEGSKQVLNRGIHFLSFDQNYLFAGYFENEYNRDTLHYYILHFGNNKVEELKSERELRKRAKELNFEKVDSMISIDDYQKIFREFGKN